MISPFQSASMIVSIILSMIIPIVVIAKYRKTKGFFKAFLFGLFMSFAQSIGANLLNLFVLNLLKDPSTGVVQVTYLLIVISVVIDVVSFLAAYLLARYLLKSVEDSKALNAVKAFSYTLMYAVSISVSMVTYFLASFPYNAGRLDEIYTGDNLAKVELLFEGADSFFFLVFGLLAIVSWIFVNTVLNTDSKDPRRLIKMALIMLVYVLINLAFSSNVLPSIVFVTGLMVLISLYIRKLRVKQ